MYGSTHEGSEKINGTAHLCNGPMHRLKGHPRVRDTQQALHTSILLEQRQAGHVCKLLQRLICQRCCSPQLLLTVRMYAHCV